MNFSSANKSSKQLQRLDRLNASLGLIGDITCRPIITRDTRGPVDWTQIPCRIQTMSRIVDLRPGRIATACARQIEPADAEAASPPDAALMPGGAEIILFPKLLPSRLNRPPKRLTRRFTLRS
jgi:hypothetical protein